MAVGVRDKEYQGNREDVVARTEACAQWSKLATKKPDLASAATITAGYCDADVLDACALAADLYDRAGAPAKAFAISKRRCDADSSAPECADLARRYALGIGTTTRLDKALELTNNGCGSLPWPACKKLGRYLDDHRLHVEAGAAYGPFCTAGNDEACYLQTRALEDADRDGACVSTDARELKAKYDELCKRHYGDSCRRSGAMCARAMADFAKPTNCRFGSGTGDGIVRFGETYHAVIELCPKTAWTPSVQKAITKLEASCKQLEASGGHCE